MAATGYRFDAEGDPFNSEELGNASVKIGIGRYSAQVIRVYVREARVVDR